MNGATLSRALPDTTRPSRFRRRARERPEPALSDQRPTPNGPGGSGDDKLRCRTVWISDTHLGTRGCQAELLLEFLDAIECEELYLVGDIVDGWSLKRSWYWDEDHNRVVRRILELSSSGTRVTYVTGNHDEFLRDWLGASFGGVELADEVAHETADGRRLLVLHGDRFDSVVRSYPWLARLGDKAYQLTLAANTLVNRVRRRLGLPFWSFSAYLKHAVKAAVSFVDRFEQTVAADARRRGYEGVVCGHIHRAQIREVDGILYCNDGDWVESCTALVEGPDGSLEIVDWIERRAELSAVSRALSA